MENLKQETIVDDPVCITPELIAIRGLIDAMDARVFKRLPLEEIKPIEPEHI